MQRKQLTLVIVSLLVVVLSVSLAYFTTQIIGKEKDVSVTSTNLQIVFTDSDGAISGSNIEPGWSATKTFTVENNSKSEYKYNIVIKDLLNTFVTNGYLKYKIISTNNGYNMTEFKDVPKSSTATDTVLAYNISIPTNVSQEYTITFQYLNDEDVDQSDDMGMKLSGTLFITEGYKTNQYPSGTLGNKLLSDKNVINTYRPNGFSSTYTADNTNTLYTSTEDNKIVYYFAGNATDNWVKFGIHQVNSEQAIGYASENSSSFTVYATMSDCEQSQSYNCRYVYSKGDPIYWRIIRSNSDGSIRLLYHGTSPDSTLSSIGSYQFNYSRDNSKYVGYMYDSNETNSTIKNAIDTWYANNLTNYIKYLSTDAIYCNDRTSTVSDNAIGFGAFTRLTNNKTPKYDCTNTSDAFSLSNTSAKLTYPIGLMTADEVSFAGGVWRTTAPAYYSKNSLGSSSTTRAWFTMSPFRWGGSSSIIFAVGSNGSLAITLVSSEVFIRPVISLKSCVKWKSGDGTASDPYTIEETESGC